MFDSRRNIKRVENSNRVKEENPVEIICSWLLRQRMWRQEGNSAICWSLSHLFDGIKSKVEGNGEGVFPSCNQGQIPFNPPLPKGDFILRKVGSNRLDYDANLLQLLGKYPKKGFKNISAMSMRLLRWKNPDKLIRY